MFDWKKETYREIKCYYVKRVCLIGRGNQILNYYRQLKEKLKSTNKNTPKNVDILFSVHDTLLG